MKIKKLKNVRFSFSGSRRYPYGVTEFHYMVDIVNLTKREAVALARFILECEGER